MTTLKLDVTEVQLSPLKPLFYRLYDSNILLFPPCVRQNAGKWADLYPFHQAVIWSRCTLTLWIPCSQQYRAALSCGSYQEPWHISHGWCPLAFWGSGLRGPLVALPVCWHFHSGAYFSEVSKTLTSGKLFYVYLSEGASGNVVNMSLTLEKSWNAVLTPSWEMLDWIALCCNLVWYRA